MTQSRQWPGIILTQPSACISACIAATLLEGETAHTQQKRDSIQDNKAADATSVQPQLLIRHNRLGFSNGGIRPPVEILNPAQGRRLQEGDCRVANHEWMGNL